MSNDASGGFFGVGMIFGFAMASAIAAIVHCDTTGAQRRSASALACKPATVLSAGNGIATCSDGRVYRWREGYLVPVGRK